VRTGPLRSGWTTGTCSAAAAKAATTALLTQQPQSSVEVVLPAGRRVRFDVERCDVDDARAEAVVVKDAGDDPDVTHGAHLTATVQWRDLPGLQIDGGVGVGVVTKPGLGLEVGGPAINPVPRQMLHDNVGEVVDLAARGVVVVLSVPDGEKRAKKTTNARLGILGGISILGTTGVVRPFSTASWRAVGGAGGRRHGGAGPADAGARHRRPHREGGDAAAARPAAGVLRRGRRLHRSGAEAGESDGLRDVVFVGMAGKLTKLASGVLMTHYTKSKVDLTVLAEVTAEAGRSPELVEACAAPTPRGTPTSCGSRPACCAPAGDLLCARVGAVLTRFSGLPPGWPWSTRTARTSWPPPSRAGWPRDHRRRPGRLRPVGTGP
jgi:cobalt-precorrin-5B (C1)-methyltransferase